MSHLNSWCWSVEEEEDEESRRVKSKLIALEELPIHDRKSEAEESQQELCSCLESIYTCWMTLPCRGPRRRRRVGYTIIMLCSRL